MPKAYVAIIGIDGDKKHRAGKFDLAKLDAVQKAAELLKMHVANPKSPEAAKLIAKLPDATILKNGKASLPIFKGPFDELFSSFISQVKQTPDLKTGSDNLAKPTDAIASWNNLAAGMTVLCPEVLPKENGYWPGTILSIARDGRITVRWDDAPRQPPSTFSPHEVCLMYPKNK